MSGWHIANARDVQWFDGSHQEGFLILSGEALLIVDGRSAAGTTSTAPVALKHGAGVEDETAVPKEAYAPFPEDKPVPFREDFLPG